MVRGTKRLIILGCGLAFMGLVLVCAGIGLGVARMNQMAQSKIVAGKVIRLEKSKENAEKKKKYEEKIPIIEYEVEGKSYTCKGVYSDHLELGETVDVVYPKGKPQEGRLDSQNEKFRSFAFVIGGFLFLTIGGGILLLIWWAKRENKRRLAMNSRSS